MEEIRRHAIDEPVKFEIIGTSRGVVQVSVYETACLKVAGANRLVYLPSAEHQLAALAKPQPEVMGAGVPIKLSHECWPPPDGQCAIPTDHGTWTWTSNLGPDPEAYGWLLLDLVWDHGCLLRARFNPSTGAFVYLRWLCCVHGG